MGNICVLERIGETQVCGRIVGGISAQDEKHVDFASPHVGDEIFDRVGLVDRIGVDGIGVENCLSDVAESLINLVGQSVNCGRLMIAGDDHARSPMASQFLHKRVGKLLLFRVF